MNTSSTRRGFLRSSCQHCLALAGATSGAAALAQAIAPTDSLPKRFTRPLTDTDEGGLWSMMDREEKRVRRSPLAIHDQALNDYLAGIVAKLVPEHAPDIRVHVVRMPYFNAMMAPNGMMMVWSGLLLRVDNEAQLAAILGHELGHYLERHAVEQLRTAKDHAVLAQVVAMVGGAVGAIGRVAIVGSMFAFSREHESCADRMGMRLMQQAGYDGREAAAVWDQLMAEMKITGGKNAGKNGGLFDTHPPAADRRDQLLKLAGNKGGATGAADYARITAPLRFGWIEDEVRRGQFEESIVLFDRMLKHTPDDVALLYARGEVYRLRDEEGDLDKAVVDLRRATSVLKAPPEAFRSLGLALRERKDGGAAATAFERYLQLAPEAGDAGLVRSYLAALKA
jgi:predicted Zn-dependent protease